VQEAGEVFYSRVSSCYVVADLYKVMNEDMRPGLREIYTRLVIDELPMVRRAAALVFTQVRFACFVTTTLSLCPRRCDVLSVVVSVCVGAGGGERRARGVRGRVSAGASSPAHSHPRHPHTSPTTSPRRQTTPTNQQQVIKSFATDEYPTVRLIGTENLLPYLKALKVIGSDDATAAAAELLPIVKAAVEDPSWRVKLAISKDFGAYADVFSPDEVASEIFPSALRLIQDQEPDVRANAMRGMTQFVGVIPLPTFISEFLNIALHLLDDPYLTARELLAEVCIDIAAKAGADALNGPLRDAIMRLVSDEDPLVRLRILKKIPTIVTAVPALCTALTDNMKAMFVDTNWRVRKELALVMPSVYTHMGQDYFVDNFMPLFLVLLRDGVGEVTHPSAPVLSLSPLPHPSLCLSCRCASRARKPCRNSRRPPTPRGSTRSCFPRCGTCPGTSSSSA